MGEKCTISKGGIGPFMLAVVAGTSMEPAFRQGDIVIGLSRGSLSCGDVIIFHDDTAKRLIIHRISSVDGNLVITRGDNNPKGLQEVLSSDRILARVVARLPRFGVLQMRKITGAKYG